MKEPELVHATQAELDALLVLAKPTFSAEQYALLGKVLQTFVYVMQKLQNAKSSIKRLRGMLFGHSTEHKSNLLGAALKSGVEAGLIEAGLIAPVAAVQTEIPKKPRAPGHGRNSAADYSGAATVECNHAELKSGDRCPHCDKGRVYDSPPRSLVKVVGQAPLGATLYKLQRLRCRLCDATFTAPLPAAVASLPKYDSSCASMIAMLRYGSGMPNYRLEGLQASLYVPLPDSTQWDIVYKSMPAPRAVFQEMIIQAAQAPLLHNDDTPMKVLSLMAERARDEAKGIKPARLAINTSGVVAVFGTHKVVLFITGHKHAGENIERVLAHRAKELQPPIQMSDALSSNTTGVYATMVANCLAHGRRYVGDITPQFPEAARRVLEDLAEVYKHDAQCRDESLSSEQRLVLHQEKSKPIMDGLHRWITEQFKLHLVEPNSGLGKAFHYLLKNWEPLTLFLRVSGAPVDNNICEQSLKRAILHRKGSMFYKTVTGAEVGDAYMSLIHTCRLCDVNPLDYLNALQRNEAVVISNAALWLPWNFRAQLTLAPS